MGTSASQASPRSGPSATSWAAVAAGYRSPEVPIDRVVKEIWRAAQSGEEANWRVLLKSAGVRLCFDTASTAESPEQALATATREISRSRQSSIAVDVAKRALVQGFSVSGDVRRGFVEALFGQVTSYLISEILPVTSEIGTEIVASPMLLSSRRTLVFRCAGRLRGSSKKLVCRRRAVRLVGAVFSIPQ